MRICRILFMTFLVMCALCAQGQTVSISGTITDSTSTVWNDCTWHATIYSPGGAPNYNGSPLNPDHASGSCSASGLFTSAGQLYNTDTITPAGALYRVTVCSNTTAPCSQLLVPVLSSSQFISLVNSELNIPMVAAFAGTIAYNSGEVYPNPIVGSRYFDNTLGYLIHWNGTDWVPDFPGTPFDPANVHITGLTIDGTVIGGTTPAAGTFTIATAANGVFSSSSSARPTVSVTSSAGAGSALYVSSNSYFGSGVAPIVLQGSSTSGGPAFGFTNTSYGTDAKTWDIYQTPTAFNFRTSNDSNSINATWLSATRSGYNIAGITSNSGAGAWVHSGAFSATGNISTTGGNIIAQGPPTTPVNVATTSSVQLLTGSATANQPSIALINSTNSLNNRMAYEQFGGSQFTLGFANDAYTQGVGILTATGGYATGITGITSNSGSGSWIHTGLFEATALAATGGASVSGGLSVSGNVIYSGGTTAFATTTPATSANNYGSPFVQWLGTYWNGTASAQDTWNFYTALGTGTNPTSTYTLQHAGTSGTASVSIPYSLTASALNNTPVGTGTPNVGLFTILSATSTLSASGYNNLVMMGAASGSSPTITVTGGNPNAGLNITTPGAGAVVLNNQIQAPTALIGGSLACTANGTNCPASTGPSFFNTAGALTGVKCFTDTTTSASVSGAFTFNTTSAGFTAVPNIAISTSYPNTVSIGPNVAVWNVASTTATSITGVVYNGSSLQLNPVTVSIVACGK